MTAPDWVDLTDSEEILWTGHPTKWELTGPLISAILLIAIGGGLSMWFDRIQNTTCDQSSLERLLSYGDIILYTAGTDRFEFVFKSIPNPIEVNAIVTRGMDGSAPDGGAV